MRESFRLSVWFLGAARRAPDGGAHTAKNRPEKPAIPDVLRNAVINVSVARREILARFLTQSGPVTVNEIQQRYGWDCQWIESRLAEWERTGKLIRGKFRKGGRGLEWCLRGGGEIARGRAPASLRKQNEGGEGA